MRLFYTQEALEERAAAFRWYQEQRGGLGFSFLAHLEYLVNNIVDFPSYAREYADGSRRAVMRKFPFVVVYTVEGDAVVITAIFHTSRKPVDLER